MSRVFVGGHSQGAFLTYMLVMNFPEEFAGAFPIAGGLIFQAEPAAYEDAAVVAAQRRVPIAIVHAPNDPVVEYSSSQHAWEAFDEAGFPALRLFDDTQAGHMFAHLPIEEALRWLEAHASDDPERLLAFAAQRSGQEGERDAAAALGKARRLDAKKALKSKLDAAAKKLDADAAKAAKPLVLKMGQGGAAWADEFFAFRTRFGLLEAAKPVLDAYAALRKVQQGPAEAVYRAARADFDQGRRDAGYTKCAEIVEKYPAFEKYRLVRRWSREKK
jgi:thioredoxin-like negative regulator of GroEL